MQHTPINTSGSLYVVATPIGNLEDITFRAIRVLKEVDLIAAEDTRHTKKLLNHYGIHTKLISYYREKEVKKANHLLQLLRNGQSIALVSDAGTPGISDPGAIVIKMAREEGLNITPIPGPSALTTALSCSGINDDTILFVGFAPSKKNQRKLLLRSLIHSDHHVVFYESPHRVHSFAKDAFDILGNRQVFIARELTKKFEELREESLDELVAETSGKNNKGEFVLIISPGKTDTPNDINIEGLLLWYRDQSGLSLKDSCKKISSDLGLSRSKIYQKAIQLWQQD